MQPENYVSRTSESVLATNKVLRSTYFLLSLTLVFSAITAGFAMMTNATPQSAIIAWLVSFGLMFAIQAMRNSAWGILLTFGFTGLLGYALGPTLNMVLQTYSNGGQLIMTSLGGTGIIFFALSGYVLTSRKDFSYLGGFLFAGFCIAILASLAGVFLHMPALDLAVSSAIMLLSAGYILYHTSMIMNGGETNYILATVSLYIAIFNIFINLLRILSFLGGRD